MKKIVSNLKFMKINDKTQLVCQGKNGKYCPVFKKQGSLDGACATYSVIMNLLILGVISDSDTQLHAKHKTREIKSLFNVFCNDHGMHRDGQTFYMIKKMLLKSFGKIIDVQHTCTKTSNYETLSTIVSVIDTGKPVIISVYNNKLNHAMLAVGYEKKDNRISRLFCLDPSGDYILVRKRWNATIETDEDRRKPLAYISIIEGEKDEESVRLEDILILSRL